MLLALILAPAFAKSIGLGKSSTSFLQKLPKQAEIMSAKAVSTSAPVALPAAVKLLIGAGGIYAAFLYYGTLQEDVFHYKSASGAKFKEAWFLQALEALANVIIGGVALLIMGGTKNLPQPEFALSGATQVCAKAFTSLALANGVSFPIVTLAKSGKMVPVMVGSLLLGGAKYTLREYLSVAAIIGGTCIVSMGKKSSGPASSVMGIIFIVLSLTCDGITGGVQKRQKNKCAELGVKAQPTDLMFWTNLYMGLTALVLAVGLGEVAPAIKFCVENPVILEKIVKFAVCSAIGQGFIFYTIANFDPLVCTTVTTTRKVFSVLLSIFLNGHQMNAQGWSGIGLASAGIMSELFDKGGKGHGDKKAEKKK